MSDPRGVSGPRVFTKCVDENVFRCRDALLQECVSQATLESDTPRSGNVSPSRQSNLPTRENKRASLSPTVSRTDETTRIVFLHELSVRYLGVSESGCWLAGDRTTMDIVLVRWSLQERESHDPVILPTEAGAYSSRASPS